MSLRAKDDWDEALEEAHQNAVARGEVQPPKEFIPGPDYDYGIGYIFNIEQVG